MPSKTNQPDLDWSQVRETVLMLNLAVARIEKAMKDGDDSVTRLAQMFTSIMGNVKVIGKAAQKMEESNEKDTVVTHFEDASKKMNEAIMAFQFYDMLLQRLTHVSNSLGSLVELIDAPARLYNPYEWYGLQEMIKSKYTLGEDLAMFEAIVNGSTVSEALQMKKKKTEKDMEAGEVELF